MSTKECKLITYLSERDVGSDIHIVKELNIDDDGNITDEIKIIKNFKRPFWVTKPIYRNYNDKKEVEDVKKLDKFMSTQSNLYKNIGMRLGERYMVRNDPRTIKRSPYIYGSDVDSRTILKHLYNKKYGEPSTPYRVGIFDIETNILTNEIIIISIITQYECRLVVLKSYADRIRDLENRLRRGIEQHIPIEAFKLDKSGKNDTNAEYKKIRERVLNNFHMEIFETEIELIKYIFHHANYMNIDFLSGWNIKYDLTEILERIENAGLDPVDIFHYDKIPREYGFFKYTEGRSKKITEAGKEIPLPPEEVWSYVTSSTNYYFIDAMNAHRYVRVGGATVPGGYSLDNILQVEGVVGKLKFDTNQGHKGAEWHIFMVDKKPLEYIIYNIWDSLAIIAMDSKTKDLAVSVPLLSMISHFDIFNSGPRKLVDGIFFFFYEEGKILGVKDPTEDNNKILGLDGWVITLNAHMVEDTGLPAFEETDSILSNGKTHVSDLDVTGAYPNATRAANVSKDTTHRELVKISGMSKEEFIVHNINLMFSDTNSLEYAQEMFKLPSLYKVIENIKK